MHAVLFSSPVERAGKKINFRTRICGELFVTREIRSAVAIENTNCGRIDTIGGSYVSTGDFNSMITLFYGTRILGVGRWTTRRRTIQHQSGFSRTRGSSRNYYETRRWKKIRREIIRHKKTRRGKFRRGTIPRRTIQGNIRHERNRHGRLVKRRRLETSKKEILVIGGFSTGWFLMGRLVAR